METIRIEIPGRSAVKFEVADRRDDALYFLLGVRKCGSSLMNAMVAALATINNRNYIDVAGRLFEASIPEDEWRTSSSLLKLLRPGNLYGGFRAMPLAYLGTPSYEAAKKILMVRDPRDALVSEYFSVAYAHSLPKETASTHDGAREELLAAREKARAAALSEFVLAKARSMNRTMMEYAQASSDPLTKLFRYEEVILAKRPWLAAMAAHFGWDGGSPPFVDGMMGWADKVPSTENPMEFVRKVLPGDHKEKLSAAVIEQLNVTLAPCLNHYGYTS